LESGEPQMGPAPVDRFTIDIRAIEPAMQVLAVEPADRASASASEVENSAKGCEGAADALQESFYVLRTSFADAKEFIRVLVSVDAQDQIRWWQRWLSAASQELDERSHDRGASMRCARHAAPPANSSSLIQRSNARSQGASATPKRSAVRLLESSEF